MTGLEKIVAQIADEAKASSENALAQAQAQADAVYAEGKEKAEQQRAAFQAGLDAEIELVLSRGHSAAKLQERKLLLQAKQETIGEMLEAARKQLCLLPEDEYFSALLKLAEKSARPQAGEILFSQKDLQRLPASFRQKLGEYSLSVSESTRELDGGFVLLYDGIEENCSFESLFAEKKENLQDKVCSLLFK
ncbi:V-type ATP synthase subunit E [Oscillospiraceae bacterium MB08-C2-2]|nr:V-type ATP synthase subunit E [Oscillospiraceae bacterium MB08-C2-2]